MNRSRQRILLIALLVMLFLMWVPTPYVVFSPGTAESVKPMVQVSQGNDRVEGDFMLVTVRVSYSNGASLLRSFFSPHTELYLKSQLFLEGETQQEYTERQHFNMASSQSSAIQAAYHQADIAYEITTSEVRIIGTVKGMPADSVLQAGDRITGFDQQEVKSREQLMDRIGQKAIGDRVSIAFNRHGVEHHAELKVAASAEQKPALGIYIANLQSVEPLDPQYKVEIAAGEIGGPSAGLMFALEIYNRLVSEDITKGYRIAGTGEMSPQGQVGPIGSVDFKVVAAHQAGAEIFFVPLRNEALAMAKAVEIKTDMQVVSVDSLQQALDYLAALPEK